jgi:hypothetical protein
LGGFKASLKDPARRAGAHGSAPPTPMTMANTAVRTFHRDGEFAARQYLTRTIQRSPYWGPTGPTNAHSWANSILDYFDTYITLATADTRRWLPMTVSSDPQFGAHTVGVRLDVVLLDGQGYVARIPLWEKGPLDAHVMETLACPILAAVGDELGAAKAVGVDFWHLRTSAATHVPARTALARQADVVGVIDRYVGAP